MAIPLRNQAADAQDPGTHATLHYGVAWAEGTARSVDARRALHAVLAHAARTGRPQLPAPTVQDAELAISELVTNAVKHAPGPCGMALRLSGDQLAITVWDTSSGRPAPRTRDPRRFGGHGLRLVHSVSHRVDVTPRAAGKQITAYLRLPPRDTPAPLDRSVLSMALADAPPGMP
ncbi:ATP-binding protein [Streptomyces sp. DT190]|jgi:anti-sigma regulatory factor (Ser/Thr protein kinase)|uniref:ATP-binding protein n=1 Tax=unclassified Streptomyces TaxID=2593676 RepID=UPI003CEC26F9